MNSFEAKKIPKNNDPSARVLLVAEALFLALAVCLPLATIDEFWIFSDEFSLLSLTHTLLVSNEIFLGTIVLTFGCLLPAFKIGCKIFKITSFERLNLHRFSMIDIFLFSFLVWMSKVTVHFSIELEAGFYFLLLTVFLGYRSAFSSSK